jgi:TolB protein
MIRALACLALVLLPAAAAAAPKVYVDITKEEDRTIAIAVAPLATTEGVLEKEMRDVLENDLRLAGYFRLVPIAKLHRDLFRIETESGRINFDSWLAWGTELLLRTSVREEGGRIVLEGLLWDCSRRDKLFGREYRGKPGQEARVVHTLVEDIVKTLTGERGISLTRIAFSISDGGPKRIAVADYDGRNMKIISPAGTLALYPEWFPDGKRLSYVTYRHGRTEIVTHDLQSGRVRSLAFFPGMNAFPAVSPDGKTVLMALSRDGNPEIYRMAVNASTLKRLTFTKAVEASPDWSGDGRRITFVSDRTGSPQLYVAGAQGGSARRISYTGRYSSSPDWSPKGPEIVFTSMIGGTFQLFLVNTETGEQLQLTTDSGNKEDPTWAPDGRHVIFSRGRGSNYRLEVMDVRTGERIALKMKKGSFSSPSWSQQ